MTDLAAAYDPPRMAPPPENSGTLAWRVDRLEHQLERRGEKISRIEDLADKHEVELHGERGVYKALHELSEQLKWVQRALWGLAASVLVAALTLALTSGGVS